MKELNLLPEEVRFDIKKYILLKNIKIFGTINLIFLILITVFLLYLIKNEKKLLNKSQEVLNRMTELNQKFIPYKKELNKIKKRIAEIDNKKKVYLFNYQIKYSPFLSTLVILNTLNEGIKITSLNYKRGAFDIIGFAKKNKFFYNYYKKLKQNNNIKSVEFFYLKRDKKTDLLNFKIRVTLKELY